MKNLLRIVFLLMLSLTFYSSNAQEDKSKRKSPPHHVEKKLKNKVIIVDYSRPSKRGRDIFGNLIKFGEVWRTGANESSWIEVSDDVMIQGKKLKAGKYGLFTIPHEDTWTVIFNNVWNEWGAYQYDKEKDVLRVNVKTQKCEPTEMFSINIEKKGELVMAWDETKVAFSIK